MVPSSPPTPVQIISGNSAGRAYFENCRARVDGFVACHFNWPGTFRLHGAALGLDILRAPVNVALAPIFALTRITAYLCRRAGWRGGADWLAGRRILLRTAVARRVEALILTDLLDLTLAKGDGARAPGTVARAVLAAPQFRECIRKRATASDADALGQRIATALGEYSGTRAAVAEMTTALCILMVGALAFQALTPGMISMVPGVADAITRATAIAEFPLGQTIGGMWYGLFRPGASPWLITATIVALVMVGSVVAAFAGMLADPVQSRLGIHRRRLLRLIDTLEVELAGEGGRPFVAHEHYYARFLDICDAIASALRVFRN
jgi:hypothetical protein